MNQRAVFSFGAFLAVILVAVLLGSVSRRSRTALPSMPPATGEVIVVASFYPLAEFARQVGGESVEVIQVTAPGVDAHDVQLSPQHILTVRSAHVFLYNGGGVEPWAERLHREVERSGVLVVSMLTTLGVPEGMNPHIWLDPVLAQRQVEVIRDVLVRVDPSRAAQYRENAERYVRALEVLDADFRRGLASCVVQEFIVAHDAFRPLAERYGLTILPLTGWSPEDEPRPRQLAALFRLVRRKKIRIVFSEALVNPNIVQTFAREVGADIRLLHPLEGLTAEEHDRGEQYLSVMRENLATLRAGLQCS